MSNASIYAGQTTLIPVVNALGNVFEEWQIATAGQTIFNLVSFQYTPGTNTLLVFRNGLFQRVGFDYVETNSTRVTFLAGLSINDRVAFFAWATSGVAIPNGGGLPAGGTTGQVPVKLSLNDYDVGWTSISAIAGLLDKPVQAVAAANTIDLTPYALTTRNITISGLTTVAGFQLANGQLWSVKIAGTFAITHSANLICPGGQSIGARPGDTFFLRAFGDNQVELLSYSKNQETVTPAGQCRLIKSGANILLARYQGQSLWINGSNEQIPGAGITLAPTGLTAGVTYFIYAAMIGGVMTLEASVTAHGTDSYGVEVKIGDGSRTLVGMIRPSAGPVFTDTAIQRFVLSWFNKRPLQLLFPLSASISTASAVYVEVNPSYRIELLAWLGENVNIGSSGPLQHTQVQTMLNLLICTGVSINGTTDAFNSTSCPGIGFAFNANTNTNIQATADGYAYVALFGTAGGGGVVTWTGSATLGQRHSLYGTTQG
jgi:hypothetical protein